MDLARQIVNLIILRQGKQQGGRLCRQGRGKQLLIRREEMPVFRERGHPLARRYAQDTPVHPDEAVA